MKKILITFIFVTLSIKNIRANDEINYITLWNTLNQYEVLYPEVVFAQAVLESGHFKSKLFINNNNLFGMKQPQKRQTLAEGKNKKGYAKFSSWVESVMDYKLWQERFIERNKIKNKNEYLRALNRSYSETAGYTAYLDKIIKKFDFLNQN